MTLHHLAKSQLVTRNGNVSLPKRQYTKPVMLPSVEGMGAKLAEGVGPSDF